MFQSFYDKLKDRGYVIYPGKLTVADSFRIGCIGRLYAEHMRGALAPSAEVLDELGVTGSASANGEASHERARNPEPKSSCNGRVYGFPKRPRSSSASTAPSPAISRRRSTPGWRRISRVSWRTVPT